MYLGGHSTITWTEFRHFLTPSPCADSFYTLSVDKNRHFLTPSPPHLVHVVIEWPLKIHKPTYTTFPIKNTFKNEDGFCTKLALKLTFYSSICTCKLLDCFCGFLIGTMQIPKGTCIANAYCQFSQQVRTNFMQTYLHCQCILSTLPAGEHQFYANILALLQSRRFFAVSLIKLHAIVMVTLGLAHNFYVTTSLLCF